MGIIQRGNLGRGKRKNGHSKRIPILDSPESLLLFSKENNIKSRPLDVEAIVKAIGIELTYELLPDEVSGILQYDDITQKWSMQINQSHHPNRQRYTIAHELGHYCLHSSNESYFEDQIFFRNTESSRTEWQANQFASEILMPENVFRKLLRQGICDVDELANKFGVSSLALRIRAKELGFSEREL